MEFDNFTSLFTPCFVLIEKIYQTLETVPVFHWLSKHLKLRQKILHCPSYFQLSSLCLDIPMKHCLSCLIYYFKTLYSSAAWSQSFNIHKTYVNSQRKILWPQRVWCTLFYLIVTTMIIHVEHNYMIIDFFKIFCTWKSSHRVIIAISVFLNMSSPYLIQINASKHVTTLK